MSHKSGMLIICWLLLSCDVWWVIADVSVDVRVRALKDVVEAVGAAGESLAKITDGIEHMTNRGVAGYSYVSAQRDRSRLKDIYARALKLWDSDQAPLIKGIHQYLSMTRPPEGEWTRTQNQIGIVLVQLRDFLENVRKERSDFILEDSYRTLASSTSDRVFLLQKLRSLPEPVTKEEREVLEQLTARYMQLLDAFEKSITALNLYLRQNR